jgi:hypothetical protein
MNIVVDKKPKYMRMLRRTQMRSLRNAVDMPLQWIRLKWWKRNYELRAGDETFARLYKEKGTVIGEAADSHWVFSRRSFWNGEIVITDAATRQEIAVAKRGRNAGITFLDGRQLMWKKASFWRNQWDWVDSYGNPLVHFYNGKQMALEPSALAFPELSLLVVVGWHLVLLQQEEDAAVVAATVTSLA